MKTLYIINGTYGVGKRTISKKLCLKLPLAIYLNADEFVFNKINNKETQIISLSNLAYIINNYLASKTYQTIILSGLFSNNEFYKNLLDKINLENVNLISVTLTCEKKTLAKRLEKNCLDKALKLNEFYQDLPTIKIDTSKLDIDHIIQKIVQLEVNNI